MNFISIFRYNLQLFLFINDIIKNIYMNLFIFKFSFNRTGYNIKVYI